MITGADGRDRSSHSLDDTGTLMSQDRGQGRGVHTVTNDRVRVADACGHHSHAYFGVAYLVEFELFNTQGGPCARGPPLP